MQVFELFPPRTAMRCSRQVAEKPAARSSLLLPRNLLNGIPGLCGDYRSLSSILNVNHAG